MKPKLLLGIFLPALIVAGAYLTVEHRARSWEARWNSFVTHWESKGENFNPAAHLPPALAADEEFAAHPWIRRLANGDAGLLETLAKMEPSLVDGYDEWDSNTNDDDEQTHHPMPSDLAWRVMQHAAAFRPDVDAFATTVRRPGCRIEHPLDPNSLGYVPWLTKLTPLNHLLGASANAAAALGDDPELTRSIETLLQAGRHLRGSNLALGVVVGCGFECTAYDVLNNLPAPENWPESARLKWVAALDLRTRTPADEFAAVCRVERGKFLKFLEGLESTPTPGP